MGVRRQILFVGDVVMCGTGGVISAGAQGGSRAAILNQKTTAGMPYRTGGAGVGNAMQGAENLYVGSNATSTYLNAIRTLQLLDGVQWSWDTILCIAGHWDARDLGAGVGGAPTLATTRARATALLDLFRTQNAACRVFWANCLPNTNAAINTATTNQNAAIAGDIAVRGDAALISVVDLNTPYAANASFGTDWGNFDAVNPYGHRVITTAIVSALTAAGY